MCVYCMMCVCVCVRVCVVYLWHAALLLTPLACCFEPYLSILVSSPPPTPSSAFSYVGELGYELFVSADQAVHVHDVIMEAGRPLGLRHAGLRALGSLRLEKGYRDYGHDMDNTDTLLEMGLGFTCDFEKEGGFIGKDAVLAQKADKSFQKKRLVQVR